jgi:diguanylate cyclase (GGDEF)-like protein
LFFVHDLIEPTMSWDARFVSIALPFGDLLLLSSAIRMCVSSARRSPAFWQLAASLVLMSLTHAAWVWLNLHGLDPISLGPFFMLSISLMGGSALHPSMTAFDARPAPPDSRTSTQRVAFIGSACLLSPVLLVVDGWLSEGDAGWLAASITSIAVFLLVIARITGLVRTVQEQADRLESMAHHDALTGIPNRRAWDAELERRLALARRSGGVLIVGIIDLDHFKHYNDLFGHPAGDALLRDAATAWQRQLRAEDLIARYGGEEFGVILHGTLREAAQIMDRFSEVTPNGQTFSAGLALWAGDESAEQLTSRADSALYVAKRDGRDRFTVSGHPGRTDLTTSFSTPPGPSPAATPLG